MSEQGRRLTCDIPRVNSVSQAEMTDKAARRDWPTRFQARAPAKLNLRLRILGQRPDGYHLLESCVVPISIFDQLTIHAAPSERPRLEVTCSSPEVPVGRNLALKAAELALRRIGTPLELRIHLEKTIPIGAGLGGGSSDAAAVLMAIDSMLQACTPQRELMAWATELGADVPFFIVGRPARVSGIGETVEPFDTGPIGPLVVAFPGSGLSTADVYRAYDASLTKYRANSTIRALTRGRIPLEELLVNDLESVAIRILPELQTLKQRLRDLGAIHTLMTGSGSAVFGIWRDLKNAREAAQRMNDDGIWARTAEVLESAPRPT